MTKNTSYSPIDCADYDYIEIACLYQYQVELELPSGKSTGTAITTEKNNLGEFLVIEKENSARESIRLDQIRRLIVKTKNARFTEHSFATLDNTNP